MFNNKSKKNHKGKSKGNSTSTASIWEEILKILTDHKEFPGRDF